MLFKLLEEDSKGEEVAFEEILLSEFLDLNFFVYCSIISSTVVKKMLHLGFTHDLFCTFTTCQH